MTKQYTHLLNSLEVNDHLSYDHAGMRVHNLGVLLRRIWCNEETSRAGLARETGLSRSAISALVDRLLSIDLIELAGSGQSTGGRKPTILRFRDDANFILGIDLGATHISIVLTNLRGKILAWKSTPCPVRDNPKETISLLNQLIDQIQRDVSFDQNQLLGIGLAVASPINPEDPGHLSPLFMPSWREIDLTQDLGLPRGVPLLIDNDANVGALAETWWGGGQNGGNLAFIKLGTGVGAGFVIDGRIFKGHGGLAGELGHIVIDPEGPECVCGLRGCLVTFVGSQALLKRASDIASNLGESEHWRPSDLMGFLKELKEGDRVARICTTEAAQRIGLAVAGLLNMMNPEVVVLGGPLALAGDALLHPLKERVLSRSLWSAVARSRILTSELGEQVIALGASTLVLQDMLTHPARFFEWGRT